MEQGKQITNRYQVISKLGQGGMGAVWRVYDRLERQEVALKQVLLPEKQLDFASKAGTDDTDKLRLSLAQEFSILATLRHPHILSVLDFGFDTEEYPFYTMDLLEGGQNVKTYATNISTGKRIKLLGQMLQALHYLHRRGVLHRDLKPDNVFVTRDEQVKVMDFGLAKQDKGQSSESDTVIGTIAYIAPEQLQGESASVASDLFAVGVMVYEIMAGKHPFDAETIGERIMKIMTHVPDFSPFPSGIVPWLRRILEKSPSARYATTYDAMVGFYQAVGVEPPAEDQAIRESFLQASKFVGREIEFKQLTDALEKIKTENAFFLIGGESGVGKSRLLDEFRVHALVSGASVLRGQGVEGGGLPFQLWRNMMRRMLLMVDVSDLQAGVLKDIVPDVGELLGRDISDAPELTGKAYQERMMLTIVDLFRKSPQPVVLLLEDVQWVSESLAVLEQMLKVREQLPHLMIVATHRDDEAHNLPEKLTGMTHTKLERLTPDAVSELSSAMLGETGKNEEVVRLLHSQSEGNIFFLVETVRALAEASGDLQRIGQGKLPEGVFTGGMQAITRRRLSKVDVQYADVQTLAAVIGREIDTKLLAHAYGEAPVGAWLSNASDYNVVNVQDNTWRFAHDKLRENILVDLTEDEQPALHRTAAETIEAVYPDDTGYNEALLSHWQVAGDLDKIYQYLLPVTKNMIEISGTYTLAEAHLHQMLERLPKDDGRCIALWNSLADSAERQGSYSASQGYAVQARELATSLDDREGLAKSLKNLADVATDQGEFARATDLYQQSLDIFRKLGDLRGTANSLSNLGIVVAYQGNYDLAVDRLRQSLAIREELRDQRGISISLTNLGVIAQQQQDYDRAANLLQQSLGIHQQIGDQNSIATSLNNLGLIANNRRDYDRASDLLQQSLAIFQQLGKKFGVADSLIELGRVALNQGDTQFASGRFSEALHITQQIALPTLFMRSVLGLAVILLQRNQTERAAQLAGLAMHNPAFDTDVGRSLEDLLPKLKAALSPDELQSALERGKSLDLDTVVQELLAEFAPPDED